MSAPVFPFEIARRDGRMTREIMCRSCAVWTAYDGEIWRHVDGTPACVDPEAFHSRADTVNAEWRALQAWKQAGAQGEPPATPTLNEIQSQTFNSTTKGTTMKNTAKKTVKSEAAPLVFKINGKPVRANVNKFGELSWSGTKGIDSDRPRITPNELAALLVTHGVLVNPRTTPWGPVTLANGVTLEAAPAWESTVTDITTKMKAHDDLQPPSGLTKSQLAEFERAKAVGRKAIVDAERVNLPILAELMAPLSAVGNARKPRPSRSKAAVAARAAAKSEPKKSAAK